METRFVIDKSRRACPQCGYIHFTDPKVGVGVLVQDNDQVLLVRRGVMPEKGKWGLPAGYLDAGEDPQKTAAREVLEETGLVVSVDRLLDVYHNSTEQGGASIFVLYQGAVSGGQLQAGDDADDARFFSLDNLPELAFASTKHALARLAAG